FHPHRMERHPQFSGDGEEGLLTPAETRGDVAIYEPDATVYHFVPASRMTPEYFERRAYFEGIADSYRTVRQNGGLTISPLAKMRRVAGKFVRSLKSMGRLTKPEDQVLSQIHERVQRARLAGFEFHQRAIRTEPNLLCWVLRSNYWNYRL